jgi:hypothetical protein
LGELRFAQRANGSVDGAETCLPLRQIKFAEILRFAQDDGGKEFRFAQDDEGEEVRFAQDHGRAVETIER